MATVIIKRKHHWSDDWQPYLLTINGAVKGNLYDNKSLTFELPEGTHEVCLRVDGIDKFSTTIAVKDKPLSLQIALNDNIIWTRYAIAAIIGVIMLLNVDMRLELIMLGLATLIGVLHYFYSRKKAFYIQMA